MNEMQTIQVRLNELDGQVAMLKDIWLKTEKRVDELERKLSGIED